MTPAATALLIAMAHTPVLKVQDATYAAECDPHCSMFCELSKNRSAQPAKKDRKQDCVGTVQPVQGVPSGWLSVVTCADEKAGRGSNIFTAPTPTVPPNASAFAIHTTTLPNYAPAPPPPPIPDRLEQCQGTIHPVQGVPNGWLSVVTCPDSADERDRNAGKRN
jgi:hypothetical protein